MRKILFLSIIIIIIQIIFGSQGVAFGDSISKLENKITLLREENQALELQVALLSSVQMISQRVDKLGLTQEQWLAATNNFSVALNP